MGISDNARKHIERSRTDRARTYDTLLQQYRHDPFLPVNALLLQCMYQLCRKVCRGMPWIGSIHSPLNAVIADSVQLPGAGPSSDRSVRCGAARRSSAR